MSTRHSYRRRATFTLLVHLLFLALFEVVFKKLVVYSSVQRATSIDLFKLLSCVASRSATSTSSYFQTSDALQSWDTNDARLRTYFENYGCVKEAFVSYDRETGKPRGFGFVVFENPTVADRVVKNKHTIDRREVRFRGAWSAGGCTDCKYRARTCAHVQVDAKHAMPRTETSAMKVGGPVPDSGQPGSGMRKIFVGGLPPGVTDEVLRQHFEQCGEVDDAVVMMDHHSKRSRGFGFVTFTQVASVEHIMHTDSRPVIFGKAVEVKRAVPREQLHQDAMLNRRRTTTAPFYQGGYAHSSAAPYGMYQQTTLTYPGALQQAGMMNSNMHPYFVAAEGDLRIPGEFAAPSQAGLPNSKGVSAPGDGWALEHPGPAHSLEQKELSWQPDLRTGSPTQPIQNVSNLPQYGYHGVPQDFYAGLENKARAAFSQAKTESRGSPEHAHSSFDNFAALGAALPSSGDFLHS